MLLEKPNNAKLQDHYSYHTPSGCVQILVWTGKVRGSAVTARSPDVAFEKPTDSELENRYCYHAPKGDQAGRYEIVRAAILGAAQVCVGQTPCSAEQTRALNALDEAMFLFNAAIARRE